MWKESLYNLQGRVVAKKWPIILDLYWMLALSFNFCGICSNSIFTCYCSFSWNWWFRTGAKCWAMDRRWSMPVQSQATQQEVRGRQVIKSSSVFAAAPRCSRYHLNFSSWQINVVLDFQRGMNPTIELHMWGIWVAWSLWESNACWS